MNEAKLKACPWCGELPEYKPWTQGHAPGYSWPHQVVHNCEIIGHQICIRACNMGLPDTKDSVFMVWNTRAGDKQPEANPNAEAIASSAVARGWTAGENEQSKPKEWKRCVYGRNEDCDQLCELWGCKAIQAEVLAAKPSNTVIDEGGAK